jgi:hypothetical protein
VSAFLVNEDGREDKNNSDDCEQVNSHSWDLDHASSLSSNGVKHIESQYHDLGVPYKFIFISFHEIKVTQEKGSWEHNESDSKDQPKAGKDLPCINEVNP